MEHQSVPQFAREIADRFDTHVQPKGDGIKLSLDRLVARDGNEFIFVDKAFDTGGDNPLFGATGTRMRPISVDEKERRKEEYKDPEWSPYHHIYTEQVENGLDMSWSEWIDREFQREGEYRMLFDPSYAHKYRETVKELTLGELSWYSGESENASDSPTWYDVECTGGGRMFHMKDRDFDRVYDETLLNVVQRVEDSGLYDRGNGESSSEAGDSSDESHADTAHSMSSEGV